ncbi:MAG TPA: hypothetical protein VE968_09040 [Sphingomicrobium sp.]|nr:hypothetical protein [Sphingomicrobium sp.]
MGLYLENVKTKKRFDVVKLKRAAPTEDQPKGKVIALILKGPTGVEFEEEFDKDRFSKLGYEQKSD